MHVSIVRVKLTRSWTFWLWRHYCFVTWVGARLFFSVWNVPLMLAFWESLSRFLSRR